MRILTHKKIPHKLKWYWHERELGKLKKKTGMHEKFNLDLSKDTEKEF